MKPGPSRIEIVPFLPAHLSALARFSKHTWNRPGTEEFFRWRYLEAPAQRVLLALRGDEVVATIAAFQRDYLFAGRRRTCLETLDWYCLPEYRGSGIGVRVLQTLMKGGDPIVAVGGTADTLALLPRLGWRCLTVATAYRLPLDAESLGQSLHRRYGIPVRAGRTAFIRPWFKPRSRLRPAGGEVREITAPGENLLSLYQGDTGYRVLPLPHLPHWRWLTSGPKAMGSFVILQFLVAGALRGWSLLRTHGPEGRQEAALIDAYAPRPDEALYTWMTSESLVRIAKWKPLGVNTETTCPYLRRALQRNRFLRAGEVPIHVWPAELEDASGPIHLGQDASDHPLIPYPAA